MGRFPTGAVVALAGGAAAWFAWLSWGLEDGGYEVWQVALAGVSAVLATVLGTILAGERGWLLGVLAGLGFTAMWSWSAARHDETGLWAVGAVMVLVGTVLGLAVVGLITGAATRRADQRAGGSGG